MSHITDAIKYNRDYYAGALNLVSIAGAIDSTRGDRLSDSVRCDINGSTSINFWVHTREDLQVLLELCRHWDKSEQANTRYIKYHSTYQDVLVEIFATDTALPPTCKIIVEEYDEPARPAERRTRTRVICDLPEAAEAVSTFTADSSQQS